MLDALRSSDRFALLESFVAIVESGSLSAAALQLGTTQPTVSRRLQTLEQALKLHLLQRSAHGMKMTEDGERCFERAKDLLAVWSAFETDLQSSHAQARGNLRVLVPHAFGQHQLVTLLAKFIRENPEVTVDWSLRDHVEDFSGLGFDCAVKVGTAPDGNVIAEEVAEVPRIVVASPTVLESHGQVTHARDLAALPWLALSTFYRHSITLSCRSSGKSERLAIHPRISTDSLYALRSAALEGLGVCVASTWILADDLASGRLVHVLPDWQAEALPVYLVYPAAPYYPARLKRFVQFMRQGVAHSLNDLVAWVPLEGADV
ncbi:MAG: LysR family transcriptional regulator [Armatimonadetes bacterium 55-13]|nr:LysR family transcriptional regulator [Armatimonadota bacterium]OJU65659.1 MAG: LysR family transcriptional regulator [Armatimonadetes bacterium 55-13]